MNISLRFTLKKFWMLMGIVLAMRFVVSPVQAQETSQDLTRAKLGKTVHLKLGLTTVDKVMEALSEQTGLTIKAADYLREHKIMVRMENLSAAVALDAIGELNDWVWYKIKAEQILVTRRKLRLDATPAAIPRLIQAAIPKDIRVYVDIATPTEDLTKYVNVFDSHFYDAQRFVGDRLLGVVAVDQAAFVNSLPPEILKGDPIPYAKLTNRQRSQLLIALVFPLLRRTDYQLLHGDLLPHVANVNNSVLSLSGGTTLLVGSLLSDGKTDTEIGFGAAIR